jgi:hypothetical protein
MRRRQYLLYLLVASLLVAPLVATGCAARQQPAPQAGPPRKQAHALKEFNEEVQKYMKLRNRAAAKIPSLKDKATPEEIVAHRKALADAIRAHRRHVRRGDIFESGSGKLLVAVIQKNLNGPGGARLRAAITDQLPRKIFLTVNQDYPDDAPLSMMPPELLLQLPTLPKELEYRFIGKHLILLDVEANLILDYVPAVLP